MNGGRDEGDVVVITGATSGIGRATALAFSQAGKIVVAAGRREDAGRNLVKDMIDRGGRGIFVQTDVSIPDSVESLYRAVWERYGRLNLALNNAGIAGEAQKMITDQSVYSWDAVMEVNLRGVWLCMKHQIPFMLKSGGGAIVNNASFLGRVGATFGIGPYVASKHGVVGLTKAASLEFARGNIRVNAICPGYTRTEMMEPALKAGAERFYTYIEGTVPMARVAEAQEIASAVLWLCSDAASYVTGQAIGADGGITAY